MGLGWVGVDRWVWTSKHRRPHGERMHTTISTAVIHRRSDLDTRVIRKYVCPMWSMRGLVSSLATPLIWYTTSCHANIHSTLRGIIAVGPSWHGKWYDAHYS